MDDQTLFHEAFAFLEGLTCGKANRRILDVGAPAGRSLIVDNCVLPVLLGMGMMFMVDPFVRFSVTFGATG